MSTDARWMRFSAKSMAQLNVLRHRFLSAIPKSLTDDKTEDKAEDKSVADAAWAQLQPTLEVLEKEMDNLNNKISNLRSRALKVLSEPLVDQNTLEKESNLDWIPFQTDDDLVGTLDQPESELEKLTADLNKKEQELSDLLTPRQDQFTCLANEMFEALRKSGRWEKLMGSLEDDKWVPDLSKRVLWDEFCGLYGIHEALRDKLGEEKYGVPRPSLLGTHPQKNIEEKRISHALEALQNSVGARTKAKIAVTDVLLSLAGIVLTLSVLAFFIALGLILFAISPSAAVTMIMVKAFCYSLGFKILEGVLFGTAASVGLFFIMMCSVFCSQPDSEFAPALNKACQAKIIELIQEKIPSKMGDEDKNTLTLFLAELQVVCEDRQCDFNRVMDRMFFDLGAGDYAEFKQEKWQDFLKILEEFRKKSKTETSFHGAETNVDHNAYLWLVAWLEKLGQGVASYQEVENGYKDRMKAAKERVRNSSGEQHDTGSACSSSTMPLSEVKRSSKKSSYVTNTKGKSSLKV